MPCLSLPSRTRGILSAARENDAAPSRPLPNTAHASSQPAGCAQSLPLFSDPYSARREACSVRFSLLDTGRPTYAAFGHHSGQRSQGLRSGCRSSAIHAAVHGVLAQFSPPSPLGPLPRRHAPRDYSLPAFRHLNVLNDHGLLSAGSKLLRCQQALSVYLHHPRRRI
jgi:hypothetical protein